MARPTVSGKITALSGDDITVETNAKTSVTVVYSSSTTFKTNPGPGGGTTSSASALKVGAFIGVTGTKNSDGSVTATTVMIGRPPSDGQGRPGRRVQGRQATAGCRRASCVTACRHRSTSYWRASSSATTRCG